MTQIDTVLFDLDGTIVHHGNALMPEIFAEWGYDHSYDEIKMAVARSIQHFYSHVTQAEEQGWVRELIREFYHLTLNELEIPDPDNTRSQAMQSFFDTNPVPPLFDDVPAVLTSLRDQGHTLGVITQRGRDGAQLFLAEHGIADYFDVLVAGDDGHGRKPTAQPFERALDVLGKAGASAVYIGDRIDDDCEGAQGAGLNKAFLIDRDEIFSMQAEDRDDFIYLTDMAQLLPHLETGS